MQKSLDFVLRKLFANQGQLYLLNQVYWGTSWGKKVYWAFLNELENLWLGNIYEHQSLLTYVNEWNSVVYNRLLAIDYDLLLKISIIDAWGRALKYGEKNWLPHIEMNNFLLSEHLDYLVHINMILLNNPDIDWIDISSYNKALLYQLTDFFSKDFTVLTDKIEEFNT